MSKLLVVILIGVVLAVLVVLGGCAVRERSIDRLCEDTGRWIKISDSPDRQGYGLYRIVDEAAEVVCWATAHYRSGGISCLPLSGTSLDY